MATEQNLLAEVEWRPAETKEKSGQVIGSEKDARSIEASFESNYGGDYPFQAYTNWKMARKDVIPGDDEVLIAELDSGQKVDVDREKWYQMKQRIDEGFLDSHFEHLENSTMRVKEPVGIGTGAVKKTKNPGVLELGGATVWPAFWGTKKNGSDGAVGVYESALDARRQWANDEDKLDGDINFTQTVTSKHAKTGHMFDKKGYVVEGISDKKYPAIWGDEGRETVVRQTDAVSNDYRFTESCDEVPELYFPEEFDQLVDYVLSEIDRTRLEHGFEPLERELKGSTERYESLKDFDEYFDVSISEETDVSKMASMEVVPTQNSDNRCYTAQEVIDKAEELSERQDLEWVSTTFDANKEYSSVLADCFMEELGYEPESFSPETLRYEEDGEMEVSDALRVQYRPEGENKIEFIDEAVEVAEKINLLDSETDKLDDPTGSKHSNYVML